MRVLATIAAAHGLASRHAVAFSVAFALCGILFGVAAIVMMAIDRRKSDARKDAAPWLYPPTPKRLAALKTKRAKLTKRHAPVKTFDRKFVAERNALLREFVEHKELV